MPDATLPTIIAGVAVYVGGQIAKAVFVDPIMEQRKVVGQIDYDLTYLAQWFANPIRYETIAPEKRPEWEKAGDTLRQHASRLRATISAIV